MIFKVYYQENALEVPVREKTKVLYVKGESERDVRLKLKERSINIEFVQSLNGAFLEYEQQSPDFNVLEIG